MEAATSMLRTSIARIIRFEQSSKNKENKEYPNISEPISRPIVDD
jgi:hypothetical protein